MDFAQKAQLDQTYSKEVASVSREKEQQEQTTREKYVLSMTKLLVHDLAD